jgi:RNA polymerase sigma-70 factor (sigma-E family)
MAGHDHDRFAEFVAARSTSLFRTAYLMVGDHGLAQDLLQEALTKTYVAWPRLRDPGKAEPYARRAVVTTAISWKRRRHWYGERPTENLPDHTPVGDGTEELALRDLVWIEILALPVRQRAAIVLRFYEDMSEAQIAEAMGCAPGTVKSQVSHGVKRLRERLGSRVDGDLDQLSTRTVN